MKGVTCVHQNNSKLRRSRNSFKIQDCRADQLQCSKEQSKASRKAIHKAISKLKANIMRFLLLQFNKTSKLKNTFQARPSIVIRQSSMTQVSQLTTKNLTSSKFKKWLIKNKSISQKISRISHLDNLQNRHKRCNNNICRFNKFKMNNNSSLNRLHLNLDQLQKAHILNLLKQPEERNVVELLSCNCSRKFSLKTNRNHSKHNNLHRFSRLNRFSKCTTFSQYIKSSQLKIKAEDL